MVRRSEPQAKLDDRAFPVRVRFKIPDSWGVWWPLDARIQAWLAAELAPGDYSALGGGGYCGNRQVTTYHFRTVAAAQRLVAAFPEFELADGTVEAWYTSPAGARGRVRGG